MIRIEKLWTSTDPELLRHLALLIKEKEQWYAYLTPLEGKCFLSCLDDPILWKEFIDFKPNVAEMSSSTEILEKLTVLFRVRFMLYDKAIESFIFFNDKDVFGVDKSLLIQCLNNYEKRKNEMYDFGTVRLLEDNFYDMYDEELEDQSSCSKKADIKEYKTSKINQQIGAFFNRVYYTLDNDKDAMIEHKLDTSDQLDFAEISSDEDISVTSNLEMENISLKYLLSAIESKRLVMAISDLELRNLLSEVWKSKSKWTSEENLGHELYDAAKKVVLELKAYTEHSTAFLNKVSKREAPDYYDVIKNPMDLGTVMKKLRNFQYNSKKEFVDDLMLIWSNCLIYNADPAHFLRKHAIAMRKKTLSLIKLVPDVVLYDRNKTNVEKNDLNDDDLELYDDETLQKLKTGTSSVKKTFSSKPIKTKDPEMDLSETYLSSNIMKTDSLLLKNNTEKVINDANMFNREYASSFNGVGSLSSIQKIEHDNDDVVYQAWKTLTKKVRAEICTIRHKLLKGDKLKGNAVAVSRSSKSMIKFQEWETGCSKNNDLNNYLNYELSGNFDSEKNNVEENWSESSYLILYNVCSGLPRIPIMNDEFYNSKSDTFQDYLFIESNPRFLPPPEGICRKIYKNIEDLRSIRKLCNKVYALKMMQQASSLYYTCFRTPEEQRPLNLEIQNKSFNLFNCIEVMSEELGFCLLGKFVSTLLYHVGFEEYQSRALDVLVDIASSFLLKLGKTLKLYLENMSDKSIEENLLHALYENGISDISLFESYIKDGIDRYSTKLNDIQRRLQAYLNETIKPSLSYFDEENLENNDSFIHGDFAEKIGEDFFGFKELGLDKEFGLSSLLVPLHLLHGKVQLGPGVSDPVNITKQETKHIPPSKFEPVTLDVIERQIGLVQPFLKSKLLESGGNKLIEDEDLFIKQKLRLPPNGKIITPLKKIGTVALNLSKKKKKLLDAKNNDSDAKKPKNEETIFPSE
ncbi:hypothetical protein PNEG_02969 [Pneumocystis murina B123]|uniref:Bromo domain-containing protein n=1 Tax=Pneumocystis murina (strain B123) TaxID=1069680 RepID=M7P4Q8_PNEMU|nr:hypothetical protein PNEG_02969 [Pneumocystis murina B123]EMR08800.1 hypothetical protein PNEG_02969 [Pneumocystis murina B123]